MMEGRGGCSLAGGRGGGGGGLGKGVGKEGPAPEVG